MTKSAIQKIFELIDKHKISLEDQRKFCIFLEEEKPNSALDVEELYYTKFLIQEAV